jgi:flagellar biosynthesis protein FlhG
VDTGVQNLKLISGSEFMPGAANPAYWFKLKMIRHIKAIDADFVVIDLGAGVHFNVLDLFGIADQGIVVTTDEPGAIINAYSFIKGALFRKIEVVFRQHPKIRPILKGLMEKGDAHGTFTIDWLAEKIQEIDPDMYPLIDEISNWFRPCLVANMMSGDMNSVLIGNLKELCNGNLGLELEQAGAIPQTKLVSRFLLNIPAIFEAPGGEAFTKAVKSITKSLLRESSDLEALAKGPKVRSDFDDETIKAIMDVVDGVDKELLSRKDRKLLKLRLFFKPKDVISFLLRKGFSHEIFFE